MFRCEGVSVRCLLCSNRFECNTPQLFFAQVKEHRQFSSWMHAGPVHVHNTSHHRHHLLGPIISPTETVSIGNVCPASELPVALTSPSSHGECARLGWTGMVSLVTTHSMPTSSASRPPDHPPSRFQSRWPTSLLWPAPRYLAPPLSLLAARPQPNLFH